MPLPLENYGKLNIRELAREAGVSLSTVSRVVRNKDDVSPETRAKIKELMRKYGYRPNMLVNGIRSGKTKTVGLIFAGDLGYDGEIIRGIHDELQKEDYVPMLQMIEKGGEPEIDLLHRLIDHRVDGVIMRVVHEEGLNLYIDELKKRGIAVVAADAVSPQYDIDFVGTNDLSASEKVARYLYDECGHRQFLVIGFSSTVQTSVLRVSAFVNCLTGCSDAKIRCAIDASYGRDIPFLIDLLNQFDRFPIAVFATNDLIACGIYSACRRLNLRIPEDVSVVGYGNLSQGEFVDPALTTVNQHPYQVGCRAAQVLLQRLNGEGDWLENKSQKELIDAEIVKRASVCQIY